MGFLDCQNERVFSEEEEEVLRSSGLLFANAVTRNEMVNQLIKRDTELEELVEERTRELAIQTTTFSTLFNSIPDLIFIKDPDSRYAHCNKALLDYFGKSMGEVVGKGDVDGLGMPADMGRQHEEKEHGIIREGRAVTVEEYLPSIDGVKTLFKTTVLPLMLDGEAVGTVGIAHDISEIREAERIMAFRYDYSKQLSDALAMITKSPNISGGDIKAAAETIAQEGCNVLSVHRISVWSLSEDGNALINITCYESSTGEHSVHGDFDLLGRPAYASLLQTERLIIASDIHESATLDDGYNPILCAMLEAPIRVDGKLVGMVCADLRGVSGKT
jgi:PAS domain S-box-containing protein